LLLQFHREIEHPDTRTQGNVKSRKLLAVAFCLISTIGIAYFLTSDGRVLVLEEDASGWAPVREEDR
jgi:hypothetical protein